MRLALVRFNDLIPQRNVSPYYELWTYGVFRQSFEMDIVPLGDCIRLLFASFAHAIYYIPTLRNSEGVFLHRWGFGSFNKWAEAGGDSNAFRLR